MLFHNDNYTTMEFVVFILQAIFNKTESDAMNIMLSVHRNGLGVAGVYTKDIAETKVEKTHALDSTWLCVARPSPTNQPPRRAHQDLVEGLCTGDPNTAAEAMRKHIAGSMQNTLKRLEPYFHLQVTNGNIFARSVKRQAKLLRANRTSKED